MNSSYSSCESVILARAPLATAPGRKTPPAAPLDPRRGPSADTRAGARASSCGSPRPRDRSPPARAASLADDDDNEEEEERARTPGPSRQGVACCLLTCACEGPRAATDRRRRCRRRRGRDGDGDDDDDRAVEAGYHVREGTRQRKSIIIIQGKVRASAVLPKWRGGSTFWALHLGPE